MPKTSIIKFLIATLFIVSCASTKRQNMCDYYKKGKFGLKSKVDNAYYIINREDSIQTETNSKTGQTATLRITWTTPCEYQLQFKTISKNNGDSIDTFIQTRPIKTKIFLATKDYCIFESHMDNVDFIYRDTIWRLKN